MNLSRWQQVVDFLVEDLMIALIQNDSFEVIPHVLYFIFRITGIISVAETGIEIRVQKVSTQRHRKSSYPFELECNYL